MERRSSKRNCLLLIQVTHFNGVGVPPLCSAVAVGGMGHVCSGEKGSAGPEWRMNEMGMLCCFCPQREMRAGGAGGLLLVVEF